MGQGGLCSSIVVRALPWLPFAITLLGPAPGLLAAEPAAFERCRAEREALRTGTAVLDLTARDGDQGLARSRARLSWSEGEGQLRLRLQMLAPAEVAGSSILLIESEGEDPAAWAWLPEIRKVRRVGGRHLRRPLFGTNLRYDDLERVRGLAGGPDPAAWREEDYRGRPAWRIEAHDAAGAVVTWLDRERCVPLRSEATDRGGRLARWVEVSSRAAAAGAFVPESLVVRDVLGRSETRVEVETLELGAAPPETAFDPAFLGRDPVPASRREEPAPGP